MWLTGGFTQTASKWKSICSTGLLTPGPAAAGQLKLPKAKCGANKHGWACGTSGRFQRTGRMAGEKAEQYPDDKRPFSNSRSLEMTVLSGFYERRPTWVSLSDPKTLRATVVF